VTFFGGLLMLTLVTNVVLDQFLGLCDATGDSSDAGSTMVFALLMTLVIVLTTIVNWTLYTVVLAPLGVAFLSPLFYVLVNIGLVALLVLAVDRITQAQTVLLTDYLIRIGSNSLVLGVAIIASLGSATLSSALGAALGGGLGFLLVSTLLGAIQHQLQIADVPKALRGMPITFVATGLMALAFLAFDLLLLQTFSG
jgi:electron transport complex protein RnfA